MRKSTISILSLASILTLSEISAHAKGLSARSDSLEIVENSKTKKPEFPRYANKEKKKHESGGGIGLSITIDPSKLFNSGKKKPAPKKRPVKRKNRPAQQLITNT